MVILDLYSFFFFFPGSLNHLVIDPTDTITLARIEREKQGTCEAEITFGGEVDLHKHLESCAKNPEHRGFIPARRFFSGHLPLRYHDSDIVDCIRALSDLTVRLTVGYVSKNRPKTVPGSKQPFPAYSDAESKMKRVGSGWICGLDKFSMEGKNQRTCECNECLNSATPKTEFGYVYISTAAHVVYDDEEGQHTTCHLFFDEGGTPETCSGVVTLNGVSRVESDLEGDTCKMTHITHDFSLINRLDKMISRSHNLNAKVRDRYATTALEDGTQWLAGPYFNGSNRNHTLTVIVSHPHGCSKQITIGHFAQMLLVKDGWTKYTYTTPTCAGSSGAPVFVLARWKNWGVLGLYYEHPHGGFCESNRKLNYSGYGWT